MGYITISLKRFEKENLADRGNCSMKISVVTAVYIVERVKNEKEGKIETC